MYYTLPRVLVKIVLRLSLDYSLLLMRIQRVLQTQLHCYYITSDASRKFPSKSSNAVKTRINSEKSKCIAVLYIIQSVAAYSPSNLEHRLVQAASGCAPSVGV